MYNQQELCERIKTLYPELGACGIDIQISFDEGKKAWVVDLRKDAQRLKTYLDTADAETCMAGKQCVSLGLQIAQLAANINNAG